MIGIVPPVVKKIVYVIFAVIAVVILLNFAGSAFGGFLHWGV